MRHNKQKNPKATGRIRIIAGQFRGRQLPVLDSPGLRPTTDRTKETLFNWLMQNVQDAICLDGFAGSGSLGFEALSRGAKHVYFVEKTSQASLQITHNAAGLGCAQNITSYHSEFSQALQNIKQNESEHSLPINILFLDPPFGEGLLIPSLCASVNHQILATDALIYLEHESAVTLMHINQALNNLSQPYHLKPIKQHVTGAFHYGLYQLLRR